MDLATASGCSRLKVALEDYENPIRTLGYYSKTSHEGYRNTIELPEGNNVVPLRSDVIRLMQYECSFHKLWSEDPNQHLNDLLKLVDSLDLDVANRKRALIRTIDQSTGGKLRDRNAKESWAVLNDLALYDNESWNDPRDFAKPVNAISLPQDVLSTSDRRLIELENQVQRLMEAYRAPKQLIQVNKITSSCEICSGPHDTQYCMENPEQAFADYVSSRNNEVGGDSMAHMNATSTDQIKKEELRSKGIKSPFKLLSPKYLSQASLKEQNRNPSSPKRVHFINYVVLLRKKDEVREEENVKPNATE
uniref:MAK10-like protein n=1 Tax=Tanacetum cinerariifolium TaxID=118510 RepID=A0A6L2MGV2_TANCI|nr:MAK10-like protein [Tanacetum cinerariifolium]